MLTALSACRRRAPRKFVEGASRAGASAECLSVSRLDIRGCQERGRCAEAGVCATGFDDMGENCSAWENAARTAISTPAFLCYMPHRARRCRTGGRPSGPGATSQARTRTAGPARRGCFWPAGPPRARACSCPWPWRVKCHSNSIAFRKTFQSLAFRQAETPDRFTPERLAEAEKAGFESARA